MSRITKLMNLKTVTFLLLISLVNVGVFSGLTTVALASGQSNSQSVTRAPVHHKKHISVSCRQLCEAGYQDCKTSGKKKGIHSCKRVYDECLDECATGH